MIIIDECHVNKKLLSICYYFSSSYFYIYISFIIDKIGHHDGRVVMETMEVKQFHNFISNNILMKIVTNITQVLLQRGASTFIFLSCPSGSYCLFFIS